MIWDSIATRREWFPSISFAGPTGFNQVSTELYKLPESSQVSSRTFSIQNGNRSKPQLKVVWSLLNLSRSSRLNAQKDNIFSQGLSLRQTLRELVLNVQSTYYDLQRARQEEDVFQGIFEFSSTFISGLTSTNAFKGDEKMIAALRARSLQAMSQRVAAQQNVIRLSAELASLMALPPDTFILPSDKLAREDEWNSRLDQTLSLAIKRREEIKIAESQSKALNNQANALFRQYIPEISFEAAAEYNTSDYRFTQAGSNSFSAKSYKLDRALGLQVKWKMFDSGVLSAQSSSFRKKALASQKQIELDRLAISAQVKSAFGIYTGQLIQLPIVKRELDQSLLSLESRTEECKTLTPTSIANLVQSLDQYQNAASRLFLLINNYNIAIARLYRFTSQWPVGVDEVIKSSLNDLSEINLETK